MPTIAIRAEYAPLVNLFRSTEETRYYLNCFLVEPAPAHCGGGVRLVATDGHCMGIFSDRFGQADSKSIWNLDAVTLKACKSARSDNDLTRWLIIEQCEPGEAGALGFHNVTVAFGDKDFPDNAIALARGTAGNDLILHRSHAKPIDGTFPDYARVLPKKFPALAKAKFQPYDARYLVDFAKVAATREGDHGTKHAAGMTIASDKLGAPSIILTERPDFFGVLMPMRGGNSARQEYPEWWTATPEAPIAAAAE